MCYMPFSAKVKIPIVLVAFFDVQQSRSLVHMEKTGRISVLPYLMSCFPKRARGVLTSCSALLATSLMLQTPEHGPALCICCFPAWTIQIELIEGRQQEGKGELCYWLYHLTPVDTKDGKLDLALVAVRLDKVWMGSELMLLGMGVGFAALEDFASGSKVRGYSSSWLACTCVGFLPLHPWPGQLDFASVMAGLERNQSTAFLVVSSFFSLFFPCTSLWSITYFFPILSRPC